MVRDGNVIMENKYWVIKRSDSNSYIAMMYWGHNEYHTMIYGYSADNFLMELEQILSIDDPALTPHHLEGLIEIIVKFSEEVLHEKIIALSAKHKAYVKNGQYYFQELGKAEPILYGEFDNILEFIKRSSTNYNKSTEDRRSLIKLSEDMEASARKNPTVLLKTRWFILQKLGTDYQMMSIGRYSRDLRPVATASTLNGMLLALEKEQSLYNTIEENQKDRSIDLNRMIQLVKSMAKYDLKAISSDVLNQIKNTQFETKVAVVYSDDYFTVMQMDLPSKLETNESYEIMIHRPHCKAKLLTTGATKYECWKYIQDKFIPSLNIYDSEDVEVLHAIRKLSNFLIPDPLSEEYDNQKSCDECDIDPSDEHASKNPSCFGSYNDVKSSHSTCNRCLTCAYEPECIKLSAERSKTAPKPSSRRSRESFTILANPKHREITTPSIRDQVIQSAITSKINKEDTTMYEKNNYNPQQRNEGMMSSMFQEFCPSEIPEGQVALTMNGRIAVRRKDGNYVLYNEATGSIENQMNFVVSSTSLSKMYILMPQPMNALQPGDIIRDKETWYQVIGTNDNFSKLKVVNLSTGAEVGIKAESNILIGQKMYRKVFSMLSMVQQQNGMQFNPMMLMLIDQLNKEPELDENGNEKDNSMLKNMLMMSMFTPMMMGMMPQAQTAPQNAPTQAGIQMPMMPTMNPMMLMWMMNGGGNMSDMMPMMLMMGMNNPAMMNMGMTPPATTQVPQQPEQVKDEEAKH